MFENLQVACPVSFDRVNENVSRINALFTILFTMAGLISGNAFFSLFLAFDFALRAFTYKGKSPVKAVSRRIAKLYNLKMKLTDAAPKKFAAGLGMVFSIIIASFLLLQLHIEAYYPGMLIIACAILESVFSFCLGCIVYSYFVMPFRRKSVKQI